MRTRMSSETSCPASMTALASLPDRAAGGDLGAQHVAGGDLHDPVPFFQALGLGAFARARRAQKNEFHRRPFARVLRIRPSY